MPVAPVAALPEATEAASAKPGRKKKLIVIAATLSVLLAGGGGAAWFMKERAAPPAATGGDGEAESKGEEGAEPAVAEVKTVRATLKHAPTFVALEPFTVNLADRESERFAQVGVSLELTDAKAGELLTAYMPAIRNNILLALGSKTAAQLMERDGKLRLATEIRREALRPLGYDIAMAAPADSGDEARAAPVAAKDEDAPIRAVHFTNFIIQ